MAKTPRILSLDSRATALETLTGPLSVGWIPYTPTVTSDGSTLASREVMTFFYKQVGKQVFIKGAITFGRLSSGAGGTFIRINLPIAAKSSLQQDGIGACSRNFSTSGTINMDTGWGRIQTSDANNLYFLRNAGVFFTDQECSTGYGMSLVIDSFYETN